MTNQEAFDKMVRHLRSLPGRSTSSMGACTYSGTKCAVGALFTEEEQARYGDYFGGVCTLLPRMSADGHHSSLHTLSMALLHDMQLVHDYKTNWGPDGFDGELNIRRIASKFGLIYTPPN